MGTIRFVGLTAMIAAGLHSIQPPLPLAQEPPQDAHRQHTASLAPPSVNDICARTLAIAIPVFDMPTTTQRQRLTRCSSSNLYYGIGRPQDFQTARWCAITQMAIDTDVPPYRKQHLNQPLLQQAGAEDTPIVPDRSILAGIYANGLGVEANIPLAMHLACKGSQLAEQNNDSRHLYGFAWDPVVRTLGDFGRRDEPTSWWHDHGVVEERFPTSRFFDACPYYGDTSGMSLCAGLEQRIVYGDFFQYMDQLNQRIPQNHRATLKRLRKSAEAYIDAANNFRFGSMARHEIPFAEAHDYRRLMQALKAIEAGRTPDLGADYPYVPNPATHPTEWRSFVSDNLGLDNMRTDISTPEGRRLAETTFRETVNARIRFERDLIAFTTARHPQYSAHQIRRMFRSL